MMKYEELKGILETLYHYNYILGKAVALEDLSQNLLKQAADFYIQDQMQMAEWCKKKSREVAILANEQREMKNSLSAGETKASRDLTEAIQKLHKFEHTVFVCPDCGYKVQPQEILNAS